MAVWNLIENVVFGSDASSVTLDDGGSSIPSTYSNLYISFLAKTDRSHIRDGLKLTFNGDTGSNYAATYIYSSYFGANSYRSSGASSIGDIEIRGDTGYGVFGTGWIWIPNYASTVGYKPFTVRSGAGSSSSTDHEWPQNIIGGQWRSTSAITSVTLTVDNGPNIITGSSFTLWGVKNDA